jgi:hypothetical protein
VPVALLVRLAGVGLRPDRADGGDVRRVRRVFPLAADVREHGGDVAAARGRRVGVGDVTLAKAWRLLCPDVQADEARAAGWHASLAGAWRKHAEAR